MNKTQLKKVADEYRSATTKMNTTGRKLLEAGYVIVIKYTDGNVISSDPIDVNTEFCDIESISISKPAMDTL